MLSLLKLPLLRNALREGAGHWRRLPIAIAFAGLAVATLSPNAHAQFSEEDRVTSVIFNDGNADGHAVAISGDYAIVGAPQTDLLGPSTGAAYILERDGAGVWSVAEKLVPTDTGANPNPVAGDFGWSVDIETSISGTFAIVGAPRQRTPFSFSVVRGAAYIYERTTSGWIEVTKLLPPDPEDYEEFGWSVALHGSLLVVGAPSESTVASESGAAYVFVSVSGVWQLDTQLIGSGLVQSNRFGSDVDLFNANVIVSAPGGGLPCCPAPAIAYVFQGTLNPGPVSYSWTEVAKHFTGNGTTISSVAISSIPASFQLVAAVGVGGSTGVLLYQNLTAPAVQIAPPAPVNPFVEFGESISLDRGSTVLTLAVGAPLSDVNGLDAGRVYLYKRTRGTPFWTSVDSLDASDAAGGDVLGRSVSVTSIDGNPRVIAGAPGVDLRGVDAGAAYIFEDSASVWTEAHQQLPYDDDPFDRFGESVAIEGAQMLVGAPGDDGENLDAGALYAFEKIGGIWSPSEKVAFPVAPILLEGDAFGTSVAISGDRAIVGAPLDDFGGIDAGAVYLFERVGGVWTEVDHAVIASDASAGARFGTSVDIDGDLAIVGSPGSNAAYIFLAGGSRLSEFRKLVGVTAGFGSRDFGASVSIRGDRAVVGDPREQSTPFPGYRAGGVYVFDGSSGWIQEARLSPPGSPGAIYFGASVATDGDVVVIGAPRFSSSSGRAYLWRRNGTTWSQVGELNPEIAILGSEFGSSVDVDAPLIAVGESGLVTTGNAFVFYMVGDSAAPLFGSLMPPTGGVAGNEHGAAVSIDGFNIAVGAPAATIGQTDAGAVTTYLPEPSVASALAAGVLALLVEARARRRRMRRLSKGRPPTSRLD
jgi:hypothetical protein